MSRDVAEDGRAMMRARSRALWGLVPTALLGPAAVVVAAGLPEERAPLAWLLLLPALVVSLALAVPVVRHLFRFALRTGGPRYAWSQALVAGALVPVLYLGVLWVPPLVLSDHAARLPRWRRRTALPLEVELLRFGGFLGALIGAGAWTLVPGWTGLALAGLWFAAIVLATTLLSRRLRPALATGAAPPPPDRNQGPGTTGPRPGRDGRTPGPPRR